MEVELQSQFGFPGKETSSPEKKATIHSSVSILLSASESLPHSGAKMVPALRQTQGEESESYKEV